MVRKVDDVEAAKMREAQDVAHARRLTRRIRYIQNKYEPSEDANYLTFLGACYRFVVKAEEFSNEPRR